MNIERLRTLQQVIKEDPQSYTQQRIFEESNTCGSAGCIAGKAIICFRGDGRELERKWLTKQYSFDSFQIAGDTLDLTEEQRERLFQEIDHEHVSEILFELTNEEEQEEYYNENYNDKENQWPWEFASA